MKISFSLFLFLPLHDNVEFKKWLNGYTVVINKKIDFQAVLWPYNASTVAVFP